MSVLIKGMEMPTNDDMNPTAVWVYPNGYAIVFKDNGNMKQYTEVVPVPPHGRLIDADALKTMWDDEVTRMLEKGIEYLDYHVDTLFSDFKHDVDKMPAIIPAREEGAKTEEDSEPWLCLSCRHYPPSSTDGKPCTQCNPSEVWHSCYDPAEEGE